MPKSKSYDVRFNSEGYDFQVADNRLVYPNQEGFSYSGIGESLVFDKYSKSPVYNSNTLDIHRKQNAMVEKLSNGDIRITEKSNLILLWVVSLFLRDQMERIVMHLQFMH